MPLHDAARDARRCLFPAHHRRRGLSASCLHFSFHWPVTHLSCAMPPVLGNRKGSNSRLGATLFIGRGLAHDLPTQFAMPNLGSWPERPPYRPNVGHRLVAVGTDCGRRRLTGHPAQFTRWEGFHLAVDQFFQAGFASGVGSEPFPEACCFASRTRRTSSSASSSRSRGRGDGDRIQGIRPSCQSRSMLGRQTAASTRAPMPISRRASLFNALAWNGSFRSRRPRGSRHRGLPCHRAP